MVGYHLPRGKLGRAEDEVGAANGGARRGAHIHVVKAIGEGGGDALKVNRLLARKPTKDHLLDGRNG